MITDSSLASVPSDPNKKSPTAEKKTPNRLLLTVLGLLCFGGLLYFGGFESFDKVTHPDYQWLVAAILGTGVMIFIFAIRWGGLLIVWSVIVLLAILLISFIPSLHWLWGLLFPMLLVLLLVELLL